MPGEVFVHRNIANVVVHTDLNCLSVIQFAVDVLKVEHIMVVGHYGCGGVRAALFGDRLGLVDNWLHHVNDVRDKHIEALQAIGLSNARVDRLCELNVIEQVANVCQTTIVRDAWERGQDLAVHGWVYGLKDGLLRDLNVTVVESGAATMKCREAVAGLG
jgi:carbonic anhydrase